MKFIASKIDNGQNGQDGELSKIFKSIVYSPQYKTLRSKEIYVYHVHEARFQHFWPNDHHSQLGL